MLLADEANDLLPEPGDLAAKGVGQGGQSLLLAGHGSGDGLELGPDRLQSRRQLQLVVEEDGRFERGPEGRGGRRGGGGWPGDLAPPQHRLRTGSPHLWAGIEAAGAGRAAGRAGAVALVRDHRVVAPVGDAGTELPAPAHGYGTPVVVVISAVPGSLVVGDGVVDEGAVGGAGRVVRTTRVVVGPRVTVVAGSVVEAVVEVGTAVVGGSVEAVDVVAVIVVDADVACTGRGRSWRREGTPATATPSPTPIAMAVAVHARRRT